MFKSQKSKWLMLAIVTCSLVSMFSVACGGVPAPSPTPTPGAPASASPSAPASTPTPTATPAPTKAQVRELRYASQVAPSSTVAQVNKRWADMIEQQSGGRLKITLYLAESLAKATEIYRAIQNGVCDIGHTTIGNDPSFTPLSMVTRLPFLGLTTAQATGSVWGELHKKFPEIQKEWQSMKPITVFGSPPDQFHFTKKAVRAPADMKGIKIIARGEWPDVIASIGAAPVNLGVGDWYTSLEKGLVEGHIIHFAAAAGFKLLDLLKYHTIFGETGASFTTNIILINIDTWNSLPPDLQKILLDTGMWQEKELERIDSDEAQRALNECKDKKHTFINLTPEEIQLWMEVGKPRHNAWIAGNVAKGPSQAIYDEAKRLINQYAK